MHSKELGVQTFYCLFHPKRGTERTTCLQKVVKEGLIGGEGALDIPRTSKEQSFIYTHPFPVHPHKEPLSSDNYRTLLIANLHHKSNST